MKILLIVYDNGTHSHYFPLGLGYIAAVLLKNGHDVQIYSQDKNHYPEEHLLKFLNENSFDVVGVGVTAGYYQYRKLLKISKAINKSEQRPFFVLGGHGPSPEPEFFIKKTGADAVIIGEGEITIVKLLEALENHYPLKNVKGIAFREGDKIIINERQPLIEDIDSIPMPAYDLFPMDYYRLTRLPYVDKTDFMISILSGRGCTFNCNFCYRMDKGFRPRSSDSIIDEIFFLKNKHGIIYFDFADELLMSSIARTVNLCEDILKANCDIKWFCEGRLNYAKPEVLNLMKRAGCVFINYGIESMDDQVLKNMNKALTTEIIKKGIEATLACGISPGFNIIWGNIGDNKITLNKGVEFLLKYDDCTQMRTIRPVTPYPGSPLYYYAIEKGLLKDCEDFYENKHINSDLLAINFTDLSDEEFHRSLLEANTRLIQNYFQKKCGAAIKEAEKLYLEKNINFRGFR